MLFQVKDHRLKEWELICLMSKVTEGANEMLEYCVKKLCLEYPEDKLGITKCTQPALYVVIAHNY